MKILVITACTAEKKIKRPNQLTREDFATPGFQRLKSKELKEYKTRAAEMYQGKGHLHLMKGVRRLRNTFGQGIADVRIISPGYGVLDEKDPIVPYDYDFRKESIDQIKSRSKKLKIKSKIECSLSRYDLAFFLLSEKYIIACLPCRLPFSVKKPVAQIFLVAEGAQKTIPVNPYIHTVYAGVKLADQLPGANKYNLKEVVFERLCKVACDRGLEVFEEVKSNPKRIIEMALNCNGGL